VGGLFKAKVTNEEEEEKRTRGKVEESEIDGHGGEERR
jgi:hypothetical protein